MTLSADADGDLGGARLASARALVVGVGALGCPAAWGLAAAGVGTLVLLDPDRVELSNLHRQWLHDGTRLGQPKVESAAARLRRAFPRLRIEASPLALDTGNVAAFFAGADVVVDATDGAAAKFLINDGAVRSGTPFVHAGILGFLGQMLAVRPGHSACYRCLFPEPPAPDEAVTCQEAGVVGPIAGVIGSLQAAAAVQLLGVGGAAPTDRLVIVDGRSGRWRQVRLARDSRCPACSRRPDTDRLAAAAAAR